MNTYTYPLFGLILAGSVMACGDDPVSPNLDVTDALTLPDTTDVSTDTGSINIANDTVVVNDTATVPNPDTQSAQDTQSAPDTSPSPEDTTEPAVEDTSVTPPAPDTTEADTQVTPLPDVDDNCELTLSAEVRDGAGTCTMCKAGDYITLVGVVKNNCATPKVYTSTLDCLVSEFTVLNIGFNSKAEYAITCGPGGLKETIAPGESFTKTRPAGKLSMGNYQLTVKFEDPAKTIKEQTFQVK